MNNTVTKVITCITVASASTKHKCGEGTQGVQSLGTCDVSLCRWSCHTVPPYHGSLVAACHTPVPVKPP